MSQQEQIERNFLKSNSLSANLKCPICFEVFLDARRAFCGHTFCKDCLQSCLKASPNCPECRSIIRMEEVGQDIIANTIIGQLLVGCPIEDCPWQGQCSLLKFHYNYECSMRPSTSKKKKKNKEKIKPLPTEEVDEEVKEKINQNIAKGSLQARVLSKCPTYPFQKNNKQTKKSQKQETNSDLDFLQQLFQ